MISPKLDIRVHQSFGAEIRFAGKGDRGEDKYKVSTKKSIIC